jgi:YVTN family beta-propeller protein
MPLATIRLMLGLVVGLALTAAEPVYLSPSAVTITPDGSTAVVAAASGQQLILVDLAGGNVTKRIELSVQANGVCLSQDGTTAYVSSDGAPGKVCIVDLGAGKVQTCITAEHTPTSPQLSPDGKNLYVCNRFSNTVGIIDLAAGKQVASIPVKREPISAVLTPDGKTLVVGNQLPVGTANGYFIAAEVQLIDTTSKKVIADIALPNGSTDLKSVAISPDGKYAYATHILGRYQVPTTQLERGWMNTNAVSVIDIAAKKALNTALLDNVDRGAPNPWGVCVSDDGKHLVVVHAGFHEISVIDRAGLHQKMDDAAAGKKVSEVTKSAEDMPNDLTTMVGIRQRIKLPGLGGRAIATSGQAVYIAEHFSDSLALVALDKDPAVAVSQIRLGPELEMTQVRQGECFFHDASLCFQQWQSCTSCHPDARTDALNWDLLNDGIGNARSSKSMLYAHKLPPTMITGIRPDAETAVRAGIRYIQFAVRPDEDAQAIDAYLASLQPLPSPYLVDGELSEAAKRGEAIFKKVNCNSCHAGPYYTDMQPYDVGTGIVGDENRPLDTPTLIEVWRTSPYLNDGRAATMGDVIEVHGSTSSLSDTEKADLTEYVLSL